MDSFTCFKSYDIRGQLGVELNEEIAYRIGRAYAEIIKPKKLNLCFFFYALKNSNLERWTITTSIPGINRDDIYKTKIPLPPIDEQRRIAAILDQADAIRRKRQKAIALTDELLRSTFLEMFGDPVINPSGR